MELMDHIQSCRSFNFINPVQTTAEAFDCAAADGGIEFWFEEEWIECQGTQQLQVRCTHLPSGEITNALIPEHDYLYNIVDTNGLKDYLKELLERRLSEG